MHQRVAPTSVTASYAPAAGDGMNPFINRLRGLLAFGVAICHAAAIALTYPTTQDIFQSTLGPVYQFTGLNYVLGFIVVSGYCIARSTAARFSLAEYAVLRVTRIFPLLIVCACIAALVEWSLFDNPDRIAVWKDGRTIERFVWSIFGQAGFHGNFGSYAPTYTVSFELLFYVIWGAAFALSPALALPLSLAVGVILYFLLPLTYEFALVLFLSWLLGAALALHEKQIKRLVFRIPLWIMWLAVLIAFFQGNQAATALNNIWLYPDSLVTIPCGVLFALVIAFHLSKNGRELQMDRWLGEISYPLFLVHGPAMIAVASALKASGVPMTFGSMVAVLLFGAAISAQILYLLVERPVMRLRKHL